MNLEDAVAALPEKYQPIYGHSELSDNASRTSEDRVAHIVRVYDLISSHLKRPLRVLDIGCAQGFFSFSLAEKGATVVGIDMDPKNIDVCESLKALYPQFDTNFRVDRAENVIRGLQDGQFDIVLGFSVLHHIVNDNGFYYALDLVKHLADRSGLLIAELALKSEPLYWAKYLPENERDILKPFPFVAELARNRTHLSNVERPIFIASGRFCVFGNYVQTFFRSSTKSNALARDAFNGTRSYYFNDDAIVKVYRFDGPHVHTNRRDMEIERNNLLSLPSDVTATELLEHGSTAMEGWNVLKKTPGSLLSEMITNRAKFDGNQVINDILRQLAFFETKGLYHNDVRLWNIIVGENKAGLIDFASITPVKSDCSWPGDLFLSFFLLIHEIFEVDNKGAVSDRHGRINPFSLPVEHRGWAIKFWQRPRSSWSFKEMLTDFEGRGGDELISESNADYWTSALETAMSIQRYEFADLSWRFEQLRQDVTAKLNANTHERPLSKDQDDIVQLSREVAAVRSELDEIRGERDKLSRQLANIIQSPQGVIFAPKELRTEIGEMHNNRLSTTGCSGVLSYGPYIDLDNGQYLVRILFDTAEQPSGAEFDAVACLGAEVLMKPIPLRFSEDRSVFTFPLSLERNYKNVEFRVRVTEETNISIIGISLRCVG
jgi:O-antigen chain-terminating methyltransferase